MTDRRKHRGAHPEDARLFGEAQLERLRCAVGDLSWLLTRGYADRSALELVGDRYRLDRRQRMAVVRSSCTDDARRDRAARCCADPRGRSLLVDGYNVLTTVETALGGGVVLVGRDGCVRDVAGVHGTWRRVAETEPALVAVGEALQRLGVPACRWLLDRPVSNSGRLKGCLLGVAEKRAWDWEVEVVMDPDAVLMQSEELVATADSQVLDRSGAWVNLVGAVLGGREGLWTVDLGGG